MVVRHGAAFHPGETKNATKSFIGSINYQRINPQIRSVTRSCGGVRGLLEDVSRARGKGLLLSPGPFNLEQLVASTNQELDEKITMLKLHSKILCKVLKV
uniref:Uncharacterized protein n=1 Tax=Kalanchoe fedtschenkoi TaxID=63787 RepID=A0A7N0ZVG7_KALFE